MTKAETCPKCGCLVKIKTLICKYSNFKVKIWACTKCDWRKRRMKPLHGDKYTNGGSATSETSRPVWGDDFIGPFP